MTPRRSSHNGRRSQTAPPRVGLFGLLGSGNLGNDASFEVVLAYLRSEHPGAVIDAMCMGPERLSDRYGIEAIPLQWYKRHEDQASGVTAIALKMGGKFVDAFRTLSWVRRHDVVIVPGMGILEASLPLKATGVPYALFLMCASGRLTGTKVALVSVGANIINQRLTRGLFNSAARLAFYRSYRDAESREAMRRRGLDVSADPVYPDRVFGLEGPPDDLGPTGTVGVGVMAYYGGNDDRRDAAGIHARYVAAMTSFVGWLLETGHRIRLFWGDEVDLLAAEEIVNGVRTGRPDLEVAAIIAEPFSSLRELMDAMAQVDAVVAIRYHNVLSALKLSKPTIAIGYSAKHDSLMADMGVSEFSQSARAIDVDRLIEQFKDLEQRSAQLKVNLAERNAERKRHVELQCSELSSLLFSAGLVNGRRRDALHGQGRSMAPRPESTAW
jgi:polysaccharide pyruvyl transferase WcaK-like protein